MEIILRYAGSPTSWANDFVGYGLAFSLFFAFPEVTRVKGHVAITFLTDNLPNRLILVRMMNGIAFLVVAVTVYISIQVFFVQLATGVQTVSATPIPKYWVEYWSYHGPHGRCSGVSFTDSSIGLRNKMADLMIVATIALILLLVSGLPIFLVFLTVNGHRVV